jgi:CIC family chloride channel protein
MVVKPKSWIPVHRREELREFATRSQQVVLLAAVTGVVTGLIVALFDRIVVDALFDHIAESALWVAAVMPGVGLVVALFIRRTIGAGASPSTADEYLHAFHDQRHRLRPRPFIARMLAAVATLGAGGPMGLEGPSMYSGSFVGSNLQRRLPRTFRNADRRVLLTAGAAAGVAAIFKAPATGAVFGLEVPYQDDLARRMLLPALVSSASGYLVFAAIKGTEPLFPIDGAVAFSFRDLAGAVAVGLIAGLGARLFAWFLRRAKRFNATTQHPVLACVAAGATIATLFAIGRALTGESLMVGVGYNVVQWASQPGRAVWLLVAILVMRCLAVVVTVGGGGVGGLFIPLVVAGALTGSATAGVVNADLSLFIVIGVAAFLGAGYRVPLAAVMFVAETTGRPAFIVPGLLAAVAAELVMGRSSVTTYQVNADDRATSDEPDEPPDAPEPVERTITAETRLPAPEVPHQGGAVNGSWPPPNGRLPAPEPRSRSA